MSLNKPIDLVLFQVNINLDYINLKYNITLGLIKQNRVFVEKLNY